jgi:hypothetical protein
MGCKIIDLAKGMQMQKKNPNIVDLEFLSKVYIRESYHLLQLSIRYLLKPHVDLYLGELGVTVFLGIMVCQQEFLLEMKRKDHSRKANFNH